MTTPEKATGGDPLFNAFVEGVDANIEYKTRPLNIGVTVIVGGVGVSGVLIGRAEFVERLDRLITPDPPPKDPAEAPIPMGEIEFFHMRDAHYIAGPGLLPTGPGILFRGALSEVAGFSLGSMGDANYSPVGL